MKRKLLLFSLLLALMAPWAANAQTTVEIGDGTTVSYYAPIGTLYNYSITEQLYTADEIEMAGTITSISFNYAGVAAKDFPIEVYMKQVDANDLSTGISLADAELVFQGTLSVTTTAGWVTIPLDNPFAYDGTSNLLIGINKGYVYWFSGETWYYTSTPNMTRYSQQDSSGYTTTTTPGTVTSNRPNIQIEIIPAGGPTCNKPDEFTAENVTTNSAILSWTGGEGTYNVEYKKTSDEAWTSALTNSTQTQFELSNLEPATNYQARVQSACGTDPETGDPVTSGWKNVSFRTECGTITNFPWTETFESYASGDFTDPCWVNEHISGNGTSIFKIYTSTMSGNSTHMLQLPDMSIGTLTKLVLPEMNLPGDNYQFVINVYRSTSTYNTSYPSEGIRVFASTDGNIEGATELAFIPRHYQVSNAVIPAEASDGWYEYELPIGFSGTCYIILRGESQYCTATYMDNFAVQQIPTCPKPRNLAYSDVTGHTANLTWVPGAEGQTQWQICLNGDEENLILVNSAEGAYTLTGLTGTTPYTAKVRAYCSETDQSPWSNQVSFTTDVTCVAPTAFAVSEVTNRNVKLSWTSEGTDWIVAYKLTSAHDSTYVEVPVTENPYILEGLTPETGYTVRVRNNCGEVDGLSTWSATRTFNTLVAYPAPINVTVDSVFAYTAYLSWDELGTATDWEVEYKLATDTAYTMSELTPDNHPFMLGGLEPLLPDTNYVIRVRSIYFTEQGDTTSLWSAVVPFTTLQTCPAPTEFAVIDSTITAYSATLNWHSNYSDSWTVKYKELVYVEGFEDNGSNIPTGWTHIGDGTLTMNTTSSRIHTGAYSLRFSGATSNNVVVLPELGVEANTLTLSFWSVAENSSYSGTFQVGYVTDATDASTFQVVGDYAAADQLSYTHVENVSLATAPVGARIAFRHTSASTSYWWWIDDIVIDNASEWRTTTADAVPFELTGLNPETDYEVVVTSNCGEETSEESASVYFTTTPSCLAPTELAVANENVTAHAATLSWTENGSATEWVIEYTAVVNDSTTVTNTINVTENPYTLTGLLAETPYAVKVQAYCSATDQSDWSNTVRFTTPVACPAPTELAVDEESITTTGATLTWNGTSDSYTLMIGEFDPDNLVESTFLNADFNDQVIPASLTNVSAYPWTIVEGHIQSGNAGISGSTSSISFTMTFDSDVTVEFDAECMGEGSSTYYDHCDFDIDGTRILYHGADLGSGWNHYTFNVTAGEHTLTWSYTKDSSVNPTGDYFAVDNIQIIGLAPAAPSSWTEYTAEEATYTFDDLTPGTSYMVYVIGNCEGEGQSLPSGTVSFTTVATCVVPTDFAATDVTAHTATLVWNGENDSYIVNYREAAGTNVMFEEGFENGIGNWTIRDGVTSTGIATSGAHSGDAAFEFYYGYDNQYLISPEITEEITEGASLQFYYTNGSSYYAPETFQVGFSSTDNALASFTFGQEYSISDLQWHLYSEQIPAGTKFICWKYTSYDMMSLTIDDIVVGVPTEAGEWMTATAADTTVVLNNLLAATTYEAMVQAVCTEDDSSAFTDIISFTTTVACPAITSLAADTVGTHMAVISWVETGEATAWQICLNGDEDNLIEVVANTDNDTITYTLEGLAQDADITVKVRANCGDEDGTSIWTSISFHTLVACERPSNLAVENIGTESATLMWEGTSDSYVVQLMPWEQVGSDQTATGLLTTYTYDLSEYSGTGFIAIRHYDVSDMFQLNVDDIVVTNAAGDIVYTQDFENGTVPSEISNMDLDGDGYVWGIRANGTDTQSNPFCNGNYCASSASWDNVALTPDNWMIISGIELGGQLTFVARGQDPAYPSENFAVYISPEDGFVEELVEGDTQIDFWDLSPNTPYAWQVKGVCGEDESQWASSFFTTLDDYLTFVTDGDWNDANNWEPAEVPTTDKNVRINANAIIPAGVVAEANKITINSGSITIKDGGQLKHKSATLPVTMEKEIAGYGESNGNYYFISTPFTGRTKFTYDANWSHVLNLTQGEYDFYAYDGNNGEDEEWVNYKAHPEHIAFISQPTSSGSGNPGMDYGRGYLYANEVNDTLNFTGVTTASINASMTKGYTYDDINKGWILVGNPYSCNGYLSFVDDEGEMLEANFYVMNAAGDNVEPAETANGIAPLTGAFVNFGATGYVKFDSEEPDQAKYTSTGKFVMSLNQEGNTVDKAVVRFGKGLNLEKMSLKNNSKLYFSMKDKDYAVVYSRNEANMPVSFKAETAGSYTINFAADGVSFKELVLVDNVNNTKVDLLANPSYTFETEAGEFAGRFTIVYRVK